MINASLSNGVLGERKHAASVFGNFKGTTKWRFMRNILVLSSVLLCFVGILHMSGDVPATTQRRRMVSLRTFLISLFATASASGQLTAGQGQVSYTGEPCAWVKFDRATGQPERVQYVNPNESGRCEYAADPKCTWFPLTATNRSVLKESEWEDVPVFGVDGVRKTQ